MDKYTIYCTEEQTLKAERLGAPIKKTWKSGGHSDLDKYIYKKPTAEQMCGWLREKGYYIVSSDIGKDRFVPICYVGKTDIAGNIVYPTYNEALFAAIDTALEHLKKKGNNNESK